MKCIYCSMELIQVGDFFICPVHGQINEKKDTQAETKKIILNLERYNNISIEFISKNNKFLIEKVQKNEFLSALWQLRDCLEFQIRYLAFIFISLLFETDHYEKLKNEAKSILNKRQGISFGDWVYLINTIFRSIGHQYLKPTLKSFFINDQGKYTILSNYLLGNSESIVNWRNRVFGHGVLKKEANWYSEELKRIIPLYYELCEHFIKWSNDSTGLNNDIMKDFIYAKKRGQMINDKTFYFYDRLKKSSNNNINRLCYINYISGELEIKSLDCWKYLYLDIEENKWKRNSFNARQYENISKSILINFEKENVPLYDINHQIIDHINTRNKALIMLRGESGIGKSYLLEDVRRTLIEEGHPSVVYHIKGNIYSDYRTFIIELSFLLKDQLPNWTQEIQTKNMYAEDIRKQFIEYINELMYSNHLNKMTIIIDGLDEISHPSMNLLNILPELSAFPEGLSIVFSQRRSINKMVKEQIERICFGKIHTIDIDPSNSSYVEALKQYIFKKTSWDDNRVQMLIEKANANFRQVSYYCYAIEDTIINFEIIHDYSNFYEVYFKKLRDKIGDELFDGFFIKNLLFFSSLKDKVTMEFLKQAGIEECKFRAAFDVFKGFIETEISDIGNEYFYLENKEAVSFLLNNSIYANMAQEVLDKFTFNAKKIYDNWMNVDFEDDFDIYCLLFLMDYEGMEDDFFDVNYIQTSLAYLKCSLKNNTPNALKLIKNLNQLDAGLFNNSNLSLLHYYNIITYIKIGEHAKATEIAENNFTFFCENLNTDKLMELLYNVGNIFDALGNRKNALKYFEMLMNIADVNNDDKYTQLAYKGLLWNLHFNDVERAYQLLIDVQCKYNDAIPSLDLIKARIFQSLGKLDEAEQLYDNYLKRATSYDDILDTPDNMIQIVEIMVICYDKNLYQKAISYGNRFLNVFESSGWLFYCYCNSWLALNLFASGDIDKAYNTLENAAKANRRVDSSLWLTMHLMSISAIFDYEMGRFNEAIEKNNQVVELANQCDDTWVYLDALCLNYAILFEIDSNQVDLEQLKLLETQGQKASLLHIQVKANILLARYTSVSEPADAMKLIDQAVAKYYEHNSLPSINELDMLYIQYMIHKKNSSPDLPSIKNTLLKKIDLIRKNGNPEFINKPIIQNIIKKVSL